MLWHAVGRMANGESLHAHVILRVFYIKMRTLESLFFPIHGSFDVVFHSGCISIDELYGSREKNTSSITKLFMYLWHHQCICSVMAYTRLT